MTVVEPPEGLKSGGVAVWRAIAAEHVLDAAQRLTLTEVCRAKDRSDAVLHQLDSVPDDQGLLSLANRTADTMKQLMAALRLPDQTGRRPQHRGMPRTQPPVGGAPDPIRSMSSLERARLASERAGRDRSNREGEPE